MGFRIGIDVGGTFTDVMASMSAGEIAASFKIPSTSHDPSAAVLEAIRELSTHGVVAADVDLFVHGTTLAINTLLQRNGEPTGLLVTEGFRDILEMRRLKLPNSTDLYGSKPAPLIPRNFVAEVSERLNAEGDVLRPLDIQGLERAVADLVAKQARSIAVCFLHSYRNSEHERKAMEYVQSRWPHLFVCSSTDLWPEYREYERCMVAVINAYTGRRMRQYYERLVDGARELGLAGQYLSTRSNGGVMSVQQAQDRPVESLLAGPAAGVMGAMFVAERAGFGQIIGMDMGGTSLDVSVVDKEIPISTESHVGDFPVIMPAVDVSSIGAGGGSIAWIDSGGVLKVGPRSAGADPGPACYGKGGEDATITDAYVHLGLLNPDAPLGGRVELHPELAERALAGLGRSLSMKAEEVAQGIIDVATSMMYTELVPMLARRGIDPRDFAFLAYGGAGPTHAFLAAQELNLPTLLIPPAPGTLCALGCLVADLRQDFVTTLTRGAKSMSDGDIADIWRRLETQAADWIGGAPKGVLVGKVALHFSMDMRYAGQSFEIPVQIAPQMRKKVSRIARAFRREYHRLFGVTDLETDTEIVNARVTVVGATSKPILTPPRGRPNAGPQRRRRVRIGGEESQVPIYLRPNLEVGEHVLGPAVIEQDDTTTVVPRGFEVQVDAFGNLIGQRV